jgi:hypothetical protein
MKKLPGEKDAPIALLTLPVFEEKNGIVSECLICGQPSSELFVDVSIGAGVPHLKKTLGLHKKCGARYLAHQSSGAKVHIGGTP